MAESLRDIDFDDELDGDCCPRCSGEGWMMESDAGPSEWGEDTYCGPEDSTITCPECKGTGYLAPIDRRGKA